MRHLLSILVDNQPGVLQRVVSLFARRNFNIDSLAVGTTSDINFSRITVALNADSYRLDQIISQLSKLPPVKAVEHLDSACAVERGIALIKIRADDLNRLNILKIADTFRANCVDLHSNSIILEVTGSPNKLNAAVNALNHFGIIELIQSGSIALNRDNIFLCNHNSKFFHKNLL